MSVKYKILLTVSAILLATLVLGYLSVSSIIVSMISDDSRRINEEMNKKWQVQGGELIEKYNNLVDMYKEMAVNYAGFYVNDPVVHQAYTVADGGDLTDPYDSATRRAREILKKHFREIISPEEISGFRLHFHTRNYRSLARIWLDNWQTEINGERVDITDDISEFRNTVKTVKENRVKVAGVEVGKEGLVVRGVCPVTAADGEYLGSVEYLWPFSEVLKKLEYNRHINHAVYIFKDYLGIAERLRDHNKYPLVGNDFVQVVTTDDRMFRQLVNAKILHGFSNDIHGLKIGDIYLAGTSILDFSGKKVGVILIAVDIRDDIASNLHEHAGMLAYIRHYKLVLALGCILSFCLIVTLLYVFISRILHELEKTTELLRDSEKNFRGLITHQLDGFALHEIIIDAAGKPVDFRFLLINSAFEAQTGMRQEDIIGKRVTEVFPEIKKHWIEKYGQVAQEQTQLRFESYFTRLRRYFDVYAFSPQKNQFACVVRDITQKKSAELEKLKLQDELLHSEKMRVIGQLAGGVAHDFNNKLSVIIGITELLQKKMNDPEDIRMLEMIMQAAEYSTDLSQKLLAFGRRNFMPFYHINIQDILTDALTMLRGKMPSNIRIEEFYQAEQLTVNGDRSQLFSCFVNIGMNAYQAMSGGGVILVRLQNKAIAAGDVRTYKDRIKPGKYIYVEFKDTGRGIAEEHMDKIFEPFFSTREVGGGNGLGLPATLGVVEHHGGTVVIQSTVGIGTTVAILLPCVSES